MLFRSEDGLEGIKRRRRELLAGLHAAVRQVAAQGLAALVQVAHFRGVVGRLVERQVGDLAVGNGNVETVAEGLDVLVAQLLGLVNGVLAFTDLAHAEALDGDRKSTRLNSSHLVISYAVFCLKNKIRTTIMTTIQRINIIYSLDLNHNRSRLKGNQTGPEFRVGITININTHTNNLISGGDRYI